MPWELTSESETFFDGKEMLATKDRRLARNKQVLKEGGESVLFHILEETAKCKIKVNIL